MRLKQRLVDSESAALARKTLAVSGFSADLEILVSAESAGNRKARLASGAWARREVCCRIARAQRSRHMGWVKAREVGAMIFGPAKAEQGKP
jgi:hypothetical protein